MLSLLLTFHAVLCAAVFLTPMSIVNIPMVLLTRLVYRSLLTCAGVRGGTSTLLCSPWRPPHSLIEKRGTATGEIPYSLDREQQFLYNEARAPPAVPELYCMDMSKPGSNTIIRANFVTGTDANRVKCSRNPSYLLIYGLKSRQVLCYWDRSGSACQHLICKHEVDVRYSQAIHAWRPSLHCHSSLVL